MAYSRRLVHYGPGPTNFKSVISDRAIAGCWFELHRQGGCGAAEILLKDNFQDREEILVGDWIAFDYESGDRWYFGRVENRQSKSPTGIQLRLEGMSIQLGEVFPGGFGVSNGDGFAPHRYAATDLFPHDPDRNIETIDSVSQTDEMVKLLMQQYVVPNTDISLNLSRVEASSPVATVTSHKFRGEESVRSIMKDLSIRTKNSSWGVDENGEYFFLQKKTSLISTYQEGVDLVRLTETVDRETMFNRITLTGGYVYSDNQQASSDLPPFYRWRGNYLEPISQAANGNRRIRIWVPWIRTKEDSRSFAREFFRIYSQPIPRFEVEVPGITTLPRPWEGEIRILDRSGSELVSQQVETVRILFDHTPRLLIDLGPEDPRVLWPEPEYDERWEIPAAGVGDFGGGTVTLSSSSEISSSSIESSSVVSSDTSEVTSSDVSSDNSSAVSSEFSSSSNSSSGSSSSEVSSSSGSSSASVTSSVSGSSGSGSSGSGGSGTGGSGTGGSSGSSGGSESGPGSGSLLLKDLFVDTVSAITTHLMDIGETGPNTVGWSGGGGWSIDTASDRAQCSTATTGLTDINADSGQTDVEVFCDVNIGDPVSGATFAGIQARNTGVAPSGFLLLLHVLFNRIYLYERSSSGGGYGTVRNSTAKTMSYNTDYNCSLSCVGTAISGSVGGTTVTYTAASSGGGSHCGFICQYGTTPNTTYYDNFYVYAR